MFLRSLFVKIDTKIHSGANAEKILKLIISYKRTSVSTKNILEVMRMGLFNVFSSRNFSATDHLITFLDKSDLNHTEVKKISDSCEGFVIPKISEKVDLPETYVFIRAKERPSDMLFSYDCSFWCSVELKLEKDVFVLANVINCRLQNSYAKAVLDVKNETDPKVELIFSSTFAMPEDFSPKFYATMLFQFGMDFGETYNVIKKYIK